MSTSPISKRPKRMATSKGSPKCKIAFEDLPLETQKEIFRNVSPTDLLSLLRVSKHFFSLASAEIYRNLDFNFTSADGSSNGAPTSHIAEAIQAIVASDQDYGQHIKSFRLGISEETSQNGLLMNRVLWDSVADPSKVLNTLILLLVKKAQTIETFQWDTPIELSGAVYQALHKIQSLHHLRVRLDVLSSMKTTVHQTYPPTPQAPQIQSQSSQLASAYAMASGSSAFNSFPALKLKKFQKKRMGAYEYWTNGRAFSGFKNLSSLSLLGISNLDCLGEIAACLKASSISLRSLTLSLSNELAIKARKPVASNPAAEEPSDTEVDGDDEQEIIDAATPNVNSSGQPVNEADIRKEKLAQEAILAKIFDLQGVAAEGKKLEKNLARLTPAIVPHFFEGDGLSFAHDLKSMLKTLLDVISGDLEKEPNRREALVIMQKAAEKYLNLHPKKAKKSAKSSSKPPKPESNKFSWEPPSIPLQGKWEASSADPPPPTDWSSNHMIDSWTVFPETNKPPDIGKQSMVYPESYMSPYEAGFSASAPKNLPPTISSFGGIANGFADKNPPKPVHQLSEKAKSGEYIQTDLELLKKLNQGFEATAPKPKIMPTSKASKSPFDYDSENESDNLKKLIAINNALPYPENQSVDREDSMDIDMEHPDENTLEVGPDQEIISEFDEKESTPRKRARFAMTEPLNSTSPGSSSAVGEPSTAQPRELSQLGGGPLDEKSPDEEMRDYIRVTHGLQLEELCLYLVPLRASVLARALDLNVLRRLTLLGVGPQEPFWLLLTRLQNHSTHVSLESIHTDNVSLAFLEFLKNLEGLEELFLLERSSKNDVDPGTPKANINITSIRRMALQKHIKTLKRLMIKNENDESWDIDAKTIRFLSIRGGGLLELAISLNMRHYHMLMQQLPGFRNLIALQFLFLRSNDRSAVLQLESLTFAADTISHLPDQKIKYLALENHMTSIERKPDFVKKFLDLQRERKQKSKGKGKGKAKVTESSSLDNSSDSDDIDDIAEITTVETRLRYGINFWEAKEIKLFRKDIRTGKL